jgi:hypothetical protein
MKQNNQERNQETKLEIPGKRASGQWNLPGSNECIRCPFLAVLGLCVLLTCEIASAQELALNVAAESQATLNSKMGVPYGVGQIEMPLEIAIQSGWHTDQAIRVSSEECEIWLPARSRFIETEPGNAEGATSESQSQKLLRIHFLFKGTVPSVVALHISGTKKLTVSAAGADVSHMELMRRWWAAIQEQEDGNSAAVRELTSNKTVDTEIYGAF